MATEILHANGKRKTAVARVWMRPGSGEIVINKRPFEEYLPREADRAAVLQPLKLTGTAEKFDLLVTVRGGGSSGQAGAIRHGISRALLVVDPDLREDLKKEGFLTRDSRMKERKKYGQRGARARYQYSKR
jgi:small subunit ribosomal protein S9